MNIMDHPRVITLLDIMQDRLDEDPIYFEQICDDMGGVLWPKMLYVGKRCRVGVDGGMGVEND